MPKHSATFTGTAPVASINLFPKVLNTVSELMAAPVGTILRDGEGDLYERRMHGMWRSSAFPYAITDEFMARFGPFEVTNHDDLTGLELAGYRLGDLVKVLTNDYAMAVGAGTNGIVERIVGPHLYLRFQGGMVCPLLPAEVEHVQSRGIHQHAHVEITEDVFRGSGLGTGSRGYVIGAAVGRIEPTWVVRLEGSSPWFAVTGNTYMFPETALKLV